jgi:hypothetical protein
VETANDHEFGIVIKTGWHEGLSYNRNKQFVMAHWLAGGADSVWHGIGTWDAEYEPGSWYHLVGVVDQSERVVKIFVNGDLVRQGRDGRRAHLQRSPLGKPGHGPLQVEHDRHQELNQSSVTSAWLQGEGDG